MKRKWAIVLMVVCGLLAVGINAGCRGSDKDDGDVIGDGGGNGGDNGGDGGGGSGGVQDQGRPQDGSSDLNLALPDLQLLAAPALVAPLNNETRYTSAESLMVQLRWREVSRATGYILSVNHSEMPVSRTSMNIRMVAGERNFYSWKVRAVRNETLGPYSETRRVNIRPLPDTLAAPRLTQPRNNHRFSTAGNITVQFEWSAVPSATHYILDVNGATVRVNGTTRSETYSSRAFEYNWRVRAMRDSTEGPWSGTRRFQIN